MTEWRRWLSWSRLALSLLGMTAATARAETTQPPAALAGVDVAALASSRDRLYVGGFDDGLWVVERDTRARRFDDPALSRHINALAWSEAEHVLWLGTARGLTRCHMAHTPSCTRLGESSAVHALLLRADGSLVAGGDAGLLFVSAQATLRFDKKHGAPFRSVWALAEDPSGLLFVGSTNGLFWGQSADFGLHPARLRRASLVSGNLPDDWVTALAERDGTLYAGTYNAGVVSFTLKDAELVSAASDPTPGYVNPAGILAIAGGRLAIGSMTGLRVGALNHTVPIETRARDITALVPASGGGYWIATRRGLEWVADM